MPLADEVKPTTLRINHACALLDCSRSKLYSLVRANKLTLVKLGYSSRITAASLESLTGGAA